MLIHYNPKKPLIVACDAFFYGVGAVLSYLMPDRSEKLIMYISSTLSKTEKNYSQIEKEGVAIIFAVKKFHQFIYGRHFTFQTDDKPLLGLLAENKPIPAMTSARIQRWTIILSGYNYTLSYRSGH